MISAGGGLVFKGPGFYATDYRKPPPPGEAGEGSKEKSTGEKHSDSKKSGGSDD
jgi:predicted nucleic acid-binding Zn ribbon protein